MLVCLPMLPGNNHDAMHSCPNTKHLKLWGTWCWQDSTSNFYICEFFCGTSTHFWVKIPYCPGIFYTLFHWTNFELTFLKLTILLWSLQIQEYYFHSKKFQNSIVIEFTIFVTTLLHAHSMKSPIQKHGTWYHIMNLNFSEGGYSLHPYDWPWKTWQITNCV